MELYASAALNGLGFALSKDRDTLKRNEAPPNRREMPSMDNVYNSTYYTKTRGEEFQRADAKWQASQSPFETGVIPKPAYASMFANPLENITSTTEPAQQRRINTLAGQSLLPEQFAHNNMQPFIKGTVTQNTCPESRRGILESHTGRGDFYQHKKEVECFFEPTTGTGNACGFMANPNDYERAHILTPKSRNNDFPISPIHVGKGLGMGYSATPEGGFQQASTLEYVKPKNVDELRVATKPRVTYELPMKGPMKGIGQRGLLGEVAKNKPETHFEQSSDMWLRTKAAITGNTERPEQLIKATSRVETHTEYAGNTKLSETAPGIGESDDYGKENTMVYENNRQDTGQETVINNLTSVVKSIIAPILDIFRHNTKEYTIDSARTYGNMQAQIPEKATTYDPVSHMMKTTIKETTVHDTTISNLRGRDKVTAAVMDNAKTTVRQTMAVEDTTRNISSHIYKVTVYNVDAVARTTVRETTKETSSALGFIGGNVSEGTGAYTVIDVDMKNTQKQYISDYEYEGIGGSKADFRPVSDEAENNAEIDATRDTLNKEAGHTPNGGGGYTGLAPEIIDMESKKLVTDSIARRDTHNVTRVAQDTARAIEPCEITKVGNNYLNANADRLDPVMLNSLKSNPYNLAINPIGH